MKKKIKKAFTLVELLVVIAILAILATVSIVGYNSFTKKAKVSNDTALVSQLNTLLTADSMVNGNASTPTDALKITSEAGYDVEKLTPTTTGYQITWNQETNQFALLDESNNVVFGEKNTDTYKNWKFVSTTEYKNNADFSQYLKGSAFTGNLNVKAGIDVGKNANIDLITYTNASTSQDVVIRTNGETTSISIKGDNDTMKHYGVANNVSILAVDLANSYHEFGSVKTLEATKGHIVLENSALVFELKKAANSDDSNLSFVSKGTVIKTDIESITKASTYDISNLEQLCAFRDFVNGGMDFGTLPVQIKADIDISSIQWTPIGTWENPYHGTFNGNNHTIKGLNRSSSDNDSTYSTGSTTHFLGNVFGLFGITGNGDVEIKNLKLSAVKIELKHGAEVGALIGYAPNNEKFKEETKNGKWSNDSNIGTNNLLVSNIIVDGEITADYSIGGVIGRIYSTGIASISNCTNNASITATGIENRGQVAGIVGYISNKDAENTTSILLSNNTNNGTIKSNFSIAGIATIGVYNNITIEGNTNTGTLCTSLTNENADFGFIVSGTNFSQDAQKNLPTSNTNTGSYSKL